MKRIVSLILIICLLTLAAEPIFAETAVDLANEYGYEVDPFYQPQVGTIVADAKTGMIVWSEDATKIWPIASVTKMMVMYLAYEAIGRGELTEDTIFAVPPDVTELSLDGEFSNNYLPTGVEYTVADMINLIIFRSSAGATMFLVHALGYGPGDFVPLMNQTAKDLGMVNTHYENIIGSENWFLGRFAPEGSAPEGNNTSTATDQAILASALVTKHPEILDLSKEAFFELKPGTDLYEAFDTINYSLEGSLYPFEGMDGIKTGSSENSAFNIVVSATRGNTRFVSSILGVGDWYDGEGAYIRSLIANGLMNRAFQNYEYTLVLAKGEHEINGQMITILDDLYDTVAKNWTPSFRLTDGLLEIEAERSFLPGFEAPKVAYTAVKEVVEDQQKPPILPDVSREIEPQVKQSLRTLSLYLGLSLLISLIVGTWLINALRRRRR